MARSELQSDASTPSTCGPVAGAALVLATLTLGSCALFSSDVQPLEAPDGTEKALQASDADRDSAIDAAIRGLKPVGTPEQLPLEFRPEGPDVGPGHCYVVVIRFGPEGQLSPDAIAHGLEVGVHLNPPNIGYDHGDGNSGTRTNPAYLGFKKLPLIGKGGVADLGCLAQKVELVPELRVHGSGSRPPAPGTGTFQLAVYERAPKPDEANAARALSQRKAELNAGDARARCDRCQHEFVLCARAPSRGDDRTHLDDCKLKFRDCLFPAAVESCPVGW